MFVLTAIPESEMTRAEGNEGICVGGWDRGASSASVKVSEDKENLVSKFCKACRQALVYTTCVSLSCKTLWNQKNSQ